MKKRKNNLLKFFQKHYLLKYSLGFLAFACVIYIFYLFIFIQFGYTSITYHYPSIDSENKLQFWQTCGWNGRTAHIPFPTLFCAHDTNTYITPFFRSIFFNGFILFGVGMIWVSIIFLFIRIFQLLKKNK